MYGALLGYGQERQDYIFSNTLSSVRIDFFVSLIFSNLADQPSFVKTPLVQ